jgi:wyosine [tRNA(Phe)-imidazoG37] synthetase (radical SAM superfamily)
MGTFLFDEIIFGPVNSRRLGVSLGINLLPTDSKFCNFNCIYCECGWTPGQGQMKSDFHPVEKVVSQLDAFLKDYVEQGKHIDTITFAGNGEPTLHPKFEQIIDETIRLRNQYYPEAKISVLSNATMLHSSKLVEALKKVDNRILKLDSAVEKTAILMNQPLGKYSVERVAGLLDQFEGDYILQTMFLRGVYKGETVDNTTEVEVNAYIDLVEKIKPKKLMIYTIARDTPADNLEKLSLDELNSIADQLRAKGFEVEVSG